MDSFLLELQISVVFMCTHRTSLVAASAFVHLKSNIYIPLVLIWNILLILVQTLKVKV